MITIAKLRSLPPKTRLRKTVLILQGTEKGLESGETPDYRYVEQLAATCSGDERLPERARTHARELAQLAATAGPSPKEAHRAVNALRHAILTFLGAEPAEWDFWEPGDTRLNAARRTVRDYFIYLDDVRSPFNVGSMFRTAESFGVRRIFLSPDCPHPDHPRSRRTSMGAADAVPWEVASFGLARQKAQELTGAGVSVLALETGGTPLSRFIFPPAGLLVVGSEELGVRPEILAVADEEAGRATIPTAGAKASLNVAVAFGVIMNWWWNASIK